MNNIPEGYKQTEVGFIHEKWEVKTLGDCLIKKPECGINADAYSNEAFMQQVVAQIRCHQNLDIFLPQSVAKLPSERELTRTLPENLKSSLPRIEELEAKLSGIHQEEGGDE